MFLDYCGPLLPAISHFLWLFLGHHWARRIFSKPTSADPGDIYLIIPDTPLQKENIYLLSNSKCIPLLQIALRYVH